MDNGLIHFGMFSYYTLANQKMHTCVLTIIHVSREHLSLSNVLKNEPQKGRQRSLSAITFRSSSRCRGHCRRSKEKQRFNAFGEKLSLIVLRSRGEKCFVSQ